MENKTYNVIVIGGGPAGMMAAGIAAQNGNKVLLIEKNELLCKKLYLTGKGRCNITNANFTSQNLIDIFGNNGKFIYSSFNSYNVKATIKFFNDNGLETKVERGNRVFPVSDRAEDVVRTLENFIYKNNVKVLKKTPVLDIVSKGGLIKKVITQNSEISADKYIICTGGLSYPETGSTGDGYKWSRKLGHRIIYPKPALIPLLLREKWINKLQGLNLKNVKISIYQNHKIDDRFGEAFFIHNGISGPIILDMSKQISDLLKNGTVTLSIDLKPALEHEKLDERIQRDFKKYINKMFKNSLFNLLPKQLIQVIIELSGISPEKKVNCITKVERKQLATLLKNLCVTVTGVKGFEKAIITSGGISLKEIDPKTMKSKIIDNLFFAGEILDLDGPTGGYNLQVCWTTGYTAGQYC